MRRALPLLLLPVLLTACGSGNKSFIPPGTYAGSTAADQPVTLDVGNEVHLNKLKGRFIKRGVIEIKDHGFRATVTCNVTDKKGEELRCTLSFPATDKTPPASEVVDLMLL